MEDGHKKIPAYKNVRTSMLPAVKDLSKKVGNSLSFRIEHTGNYPKVVGTDKEGWRGFAYLANCLDSAKIAIKMDYLMRTNKNGRRKE